MQETIQFVRPTCVHIHDKAGHVSSLHQISEHRFHPGGRSAISLSSYLTGHPPTKHLFASLPDLADAFYSSAKPRKRGTPLRVTPTAAEPIIVGTAFDYWLRAWIARTWSAVPRAEGKWVAEAAMDMPQFAFADPETDALEHRLKEVRDLYNAYVAGGEQLLAALLRGCLFLARLDLIYRANVDEPDFFRINPKDLEDLQALAKLAMARRYVFAPKERVIFNPHFRALGRLVGGADADLVIDDLLLDIKVSARARSPRTAYQRQLIGYWILAAMQGEPWPIRRLGVYIARDGTLFTLPVERLIERVDLMDFTRSFLKEVERCRSGGKRNGTVLLRSLAPQFQHLAMAIREMASSLAPADRHAGHQVRR